VKLLTVNYEMPPQGGGAGVIMNDLARSLRNVPNVKNRLICGWDYRFGSPPVTEGIALTPISVRRKSLHETGGRAVGQFLFGAARAIRRLDPDSYDVAHFHFSVPTGLLAPAIGGKPFVCSLHGIDVPGFVAEAQLFQRLTAPLNKLVWKRAAQLFAPSRWVADLVRQGLPSAPVQVIPHAVNADAFAIKEAYGSHARRFVTVARLTAWKRVAHVVEAVIRLRGSVPDATLDVYGDGDQRDGMQDVVQAAGAGDYITFHGLVSREKLQQSLCAYDAFVLPSVSEAFGLVFLEAMAAGLPVVGFAAAGPAEIISDGADGIILHEDRVGAVLDAVSRLATTDGLAERLGRHARRSVLRKYALDVVTPMYVDAYESARLAS
jgi:glycosyltransferase involved in cell wall biosynthesis